MNEEDEDDSSGKFKAWLIAMSLLAGLVAYDLLAEPDVTAFSSFGVKRFLIAAGIALGYPIAGAVAVKLCALMRHMAYPKDNGELTVEGKLLAGAFWPLALLISFVYYSFLAIIHRLFK